MGHNGAMFLGSNRRRTQRITVGVIIGTLVISLALSLLSMAFAATSSAGHPVVATASQDASTPTTAPAENPLMDSSGDPKPVTKTPQGQATQVTDKEHIGGLVAFLAFMLGGVLLLVRGRRRDRRELASPRILS